MRAVLFGLFTVSMLVLLIACSTAASLVAIRFGQRGAELGLHRALGASNVRIATDLARELVLLAAAACVGGVLVAHFVLAALRPLAAETLPRAEGIAIDAATLWFAAAAAAATVLLTGAASLRGLRNDPGKRLRPGARQLVEGGRKPAVLPIAAVGMASVALAAALALSVSLAQLRNVPIGFRTQDVVALSLAFVRRPPAETDQGVDRALERLRGVPGVADAAAAGGVPTSALSTGRSQVSEPTASGPRRSFTWRRRAITAFSASRFAAAGTSRRPTSRGRSESPSSTRRWPERCSATRIRSAKHCCSSPARSRSSSWALPPTGTTRACERRPTPRSWWRFANGAARARDAARAVGERAAADVEDAAWRHRERSRSAVNSSSRASR